MFIQVIQGRAADAEGLRRQVERWQEEVRPGAVGYLGATGGIADDGSVILLARFESQEAAQANSDRAEQGAWWSETAKCFDGDVMFRDCADVETTLAGGSDAAGFVQVMQGWVTNRARLQELEAGFMPQLAELRPDLIGSVRAWDGDHYTEAIYFTSEAEARKGEASMTEEMPDELQEYLSLAQDLTYMDLKEPWLFSA
jgi:hypothetical protein